MSDREALGLKIWVNESGTNILNKNNMVVSRRINDKAYGV